jgi:hypothetical protein
MKAIDKIRNNLIDTRGIEKAVLIAFLQVESGGKGFAPDGRLIIQFEPHWFRKQASYAPTGAWSVNKIDRQSAEWIAFNDAAQHDASAAIEATSLGLPQIMGFHWKRLGYASAHAMWDSFSASEENQLDALIRFIETDKNLHKAILEKDWHKIAMIYNGAGYAALAHKIGREPYNVSMQKAYAAEIARAQELN